MKVDIDLGQNHLGVQVPDAQVVSVRREPPAPPIADVVAAIGTALETPVRFPPLRPALTPPDHATIVLDELLVPVFEHLARAQIAPAAITLLCPTEELRERWKSALPEAARVEAHDPHDRKQLRYLATTQGGRRIYLNRAVVEADQLVVLTRRGYDPLLGYSGSEGALFPVLSDDETRRELCGELSMAAPEEVDWPVRDEAVEVAWLLGTPFLIQLIDGPGESLAHVVGGTADSSADAEELLDARWRTVLPEPADTVVASLSGTAAEQDFRALARALACAARVVKPNGRIVILSHASGELGPGAELLRQFDDPQHALAALREQNPPDLAAAFQWANGVQQASVYLMSALPSDAAEELFTTPVENERQVQRLLDNNGTCVFLPDADKTLAVLE
jgi:nickel-dependent lactate racemase